MRSRRSRAAPLFVLCCLLARPALAQEPPASRPAADDVRTVRARELFLQGAALARQSRWRDAVEAFEESARLRPHAGTSYNLGFSERALGRVTRAWRWFTRALAQHDASGGRELGPAVAADARRYREEAETSIARLRLTVDPPDGLLAVDGRPLERVPRPGDRQLLVAGTRAAGPGERVPAASFEVWLDPGSHVLVLSRPGAPDTVVTEVFTSGARRALALKLAPAPATMAASAPAPGIAPSPPPAGARRRHLWTFGLGGLGVAAVATGTGLGLWARSTWSDAKAACPARTTCPDDRGSRLSRDAQLRANLATAAFVVGAAALVGAGAVWLFGRPRSAEARRLTLAPFAAPGAAVLVLTGEYR